MENRNLPVQAVDLNAPGTIGLTKREYAAIAIMAGYASDSECVVDPDTKADWAVTEADALFRRLDK